MPVNLSIKNVPDELVEKLRERAKRHHRSLQKELLAILEEALSPKPLTVEEAYRRIRSLGIQTPDETAAMVRRTAMPAKVVDASVLGALIFGEPKAEEALALLKGADLYAPPLFAYETTSVAYKEATKYPNLRGKIFEALEVGLSMGINFTEVDHMGVLEMALSTGLTTYDASYLYLARSLNIPLVTFDEKLARFMREE